MPGGKPNSPLTCIFPPMGRVLELSIPSQVHVYDFTFTFLSTNKGQRHASSNKGNGLIISGLDL